MKRKIYIPTEKRRAALRNMAIAGIWGMTMVTANLWGASPLPNRIVFGLVCFVVGSFDLIMTDPYREHLNRKEEELRMKERRTPKKVTA